MASLVSGGVRNPVEIVEHDLLIEFAGLLSDEAIASLAVEEVRAFDGAKVRDFIPILAWRLARERAWRLLASAAGGVEVAEEPRWAHGPDVDGSHRR